MNKYISILASAAMLCSLASCDKDTEGLTSVTYYPVVEIAGPVYDLAIAGTPYQEPGYSATLDGEDYTADVQVTTAMSFTDPQPGYYTITYSASNADGFSSSATRRVLVYDAADKVSGYYMTDPESYRVAAATTFYGAAYRIAVYGTADGTYAVDDLLGGWYAQRAGYGASYAMQGEIAIADDGTVSLVDSFLPGWGDSANSLTDGVCDPEAGTLSYVVGYAADPEMFFHVILSK